ncbi:MAG: hypothetical protein LBM93_01695, partial [Oscillospiraceae bacterium]|nr:hypothetical protein [Oscillospiraceae bacterium]
MLENAKLIILSEFNNYKYFLKQGIKPESFYTDLELFRKQSAFFNKVRILVVFGGVCNFSRKNVLKVIEALIERAT